MSRSLLRSRVPYHSACRLCLSSTLQPLDLNNNYRPGKSTYTNTGQPVVYKFTDRCHWRTPTAANKYHIIYQIKFTAPTTRQVSASDKYLSNTRAVGTLPYKLRPMTWCLLPFSGVTSARTYSGLYCPTERTVLDWQKQI
jgi:hypothetical protein